MNSRLTRVTNGILGRFRAELAAMHDQAQIEQRAQMAKLVRSLRIGGERP